MSGGSFHGHDDDRIVPDALNLLPKRARQDLLTELTLQRLLQACRIHMDDVDAELKRIEHASDRDDLREMGIGYE